MDGFMDGISLESEDGISLGPEDGIRLGFVDNSALGSVDGKTLGLFVEILLGSDEGSFEGRLVGI